jgi:hypothetical protein
MRLLFESPKGCKSQEKDKIKTITRFLTPLLAVLLVASMAFGQGSSTYRKIKISCLGERGIVARRGRLLEDSILVDPYGPGFCVFRAKRGQHAEVCHLLSPGLRCR